jgi:hypothetical protein
MKKKNPYANNKKVVKDFTSVAKIRKKLPTQKTKKNVIDCTSVAKIRRILMVCFVKCNKEELQCSHFQYFLKSFANLKSRQNDVAKEAKMLRSAVISYFV